MKKYKTYQGYQRLYSIKSPDGYRHISERFIEVLTRRPYIGKRKSFILAKYYNTGLDFLM